MGTAEHPRRPPTPSGFTALEVVVALSLLVLTLTVVLGPINSSIWATIKASRQAEPTLQSRTALDWVSARLRHATSIPTALCSEIQFSGEWAGTVSTFRYWLNAQTLMEDVSGTVNPVTDPARVRVQAFTLTYYDQTGSRLTCPVGAPASIRQIRIELRVVPAVTSIRQPEPPVTFGTDVRPRNL